MELLTLGSDFRPKRLVEDYESLIWTERYSTGGDFELISGDVAKTLEFLPLDSSVTLRESTVPMVVEGHKINKPLRGRPRITVTGRSYESVLERRGSVVSMPSSAQRVAWAVNADKSSDAAYKAIRSVIGDVARSNLPALSPAVTPFDAIPQIELPLPTDYSTGLSLPFEIRAGNLYEVVLELVNANHHGLRAIRPLETSSKYTVDVQIYNGANLTGEGPTGDPNLVVAFDARFDQFDDATYLLSKQGSTNVAYVYGVNGSREVYKNTFVNPGDAPSGLDRRVLVLDEQGDATLNSPDVLTSRGLVELYKRNYIAIFDGETSIQASSLFNKPVAQGGYALGDIIKLVGDYGLTRNVRVTEFIRTSDSSGNSAYPAFEVVED